MTIYTDEKWKSRKNPQENQKKFYYKRVFVNLKNLKEKDG